MSLSTFKSAIATFGEEYVTIGGGEPTVHPRFWEIMMYTIANCDSLWLATNGKKTKDALMLAKLANKGVIGCDLSLDSYHEPIHPQVIGAFDRTYKIGYGSTAKDNRSIRNVNGKIKAHGRALENMLYDTDKDCCCDGGLITPGGIVVWCGCKDAPIIGNVWEGIFEKYKENFYDYECYSKYLEMKPEGV